MDHNEAIAMQATEKYILGELSPDARDQFEDHLFDCRECALDLRAAATFVEQSKIVLEKPLSRPDRTAHALPAWWQWWRPAIAIPVMALLLAVIGYQAASRSSYPVGRPELISSVSLIAAGTRGANGAETAIPGGRPFVVYLDVPPVSDAASYAADLLGPKGELLWSIPISSEVVKDTVTLNVPPVAKGGSYSLHVRAIDSKGQSTDTGVYPLRAGQN